MSFKTWICSGSIAMSSCPRKLVIHAPDGENGHGIRRTQSAADASSSRSEEKQETVSRYHGSKRNVFHRRSLSDFPNGMPGRVIVYGKEDQNVSRSTKIGHSGTSTSGSTRQGKVDAPERANSGCSRHSGKARPSSSGSRVSRLPTIPSGSELYEFAEMPTPYQKRRRRLTKSMTDLEFYEIKGFMDLGFEFNQQELSPEVIRVVPGLKRIGRENSIPTSPVSRPYLSENWYTPRVPTLPQKPMKKELKDWAKAVACLIPAGVLTRFSIFGFKYACANLQLYYYLN